MGRTSGSDGSGDERQVSRASLRLVVRQLVVVIRCVLVQVLCM